MVRRLTNDPQGFIEEPMHLSLNPSLHTPPQIEPDQKKSSDAERHTDHLYTHGSDPIQQDQTKQIQEHNSRKATHPSALAWQGVDTMIVGQVAKAQHADEVAKPGKLEMFKRFVANIVNPAPAETASVQAKKTEQSGKVKDVVANKSKTEAAQRVEIIGAAEKTEDKTASIFSTVVDKFINSFDWVWGKSSDSSESAPIETKKITDEEKKQLQNLLKAMNELLHQIKDITEDGQESIKFEELMKFMRLAKEEEGTMARERMLGYYKQSQELHKERFKKMEETIELAKQGKYGTRFASFASAAQIAATAAGLTSPWGAIALLFAAGNAVDTMFDDPVKKLLVSPFAQGDLDSEQKGLAYLKMGMGLLAFGVMMGMSGANPFDGLQRAAHALKGSSMVTSAIQENRTSTHDGVMKELKHNIDEKDGKVKATLKDIDRLITLEHELYTRQWQEKSNQTELATGLFR